jgi:hypothetical protein
VSVRAPLLGRVLLATALAPCPVAADAPTQRRQALIRLILLPVDGSDALS